jgi:SAM-dependent methyltransferase
VSGGPGAAGAVDSDHVNPDEAGGNVYDKYESKNPVERYMVGGFLRQFDSLVELTGAGDAHEVGCGEGELSMRMATEGLRVRGTDAFPDVIGEARRRAAGAGLEISYEARPVQDLAPPQDRAELVVCCEVLEHLEDPEGALETLASLASPWLIASVPREPIWRVMNMGRGAYIRDWGNTPGHVNHWSKRGFERFLETRFDVEVLRSPTPWTMALCRVA